MKKIMLLGGSRYLLPVIETIHSLGYLAITCDYLPKNIAHQFSDEYHNISIVELDQVLALARARKIDGIMSFATDPGVITAAYVAERMQLPSVGTFEAVSILQNKAQFRKFLDENGFNTPKARSYQCYEEVAEDISSIDFPVIVKPVDSAGSKGVSRVDKAADLKKAIKYALSFSKSKRIIIEEYIESEGYASDSECFSVNGKLVFASFNNQRFDRRAVNPYTPAAFSWPSTIPEESQLYLQEELQRLITLLDLKTSLYNFECRLGKNGLPYIMELSPRGGGNRLAEMLRYASNVDLIKGAVLAAVGEPPLVSQNPIYNGNWAEVILHANTEGIFQGLKIDSDVELNNIVEKDIWISLGSKVRPFTGANETIGTIVLKFNTQEELAERLDNIDEWLKVHIEEHIK